MGHTTWFDMNQQRKANRRNFNYRDGRQRRRYGYAAIIDKKSGEVIASAKNGCFGRLKGLDADLYQEWAQGTRGQE